MIDPKEINDIIRFNQNEIRIARNNAETIEEVKYYSERLLELSELDPEYQENEEELSHLLILLNILKDTYDPLRLNYDQLRAKYDECEKLLASVASSSQFQVLAAKQIASMSGYYPLCNISLTDLFQSGLIGLIERCQSNTANMLVEAQHSHKLVTDNLKSIISAPNSFEDILQISLLSSSSIVVANSLALYDYHVKEIETDKTNMGDLNKIYSAEKSFFEGLFTLRQTAQEMGLLTQHDASLILTKPSNPTSPLQKQYLH